MSSMSLRNVSANVTDNTTSYEAPEAAVPISIAVLIICFLILIGNIFIFAAIKVSNSLNKMTYYLLGNIAITDVLFAFGLGLRMVLFLMNSARFSCLTRFLMVLSGGGSMSGVLILSLQSFLCLAFPTKFKSVFKLRTVGLLLLVSWIAWTCYTAVGNFVAFTDDVCYLVEERNNKYWIGILIISGLTHILVLIFLQSASVYLINKQHRKLDRQIQNANPLNPADRTNSERRKIRLQRRSRIVSMITAVLLLFLVSWGPLYLGLALFTFCPNQCGINLSTMRSLANLSILNSMGNIFIYIKKSKEFRQALRYICRCSNQVGNNDSSN